MSKIKDELVKSTDLSTKRNESHQDFLSRLVKAVTELSDDEWEKLSAPAQDWFNDAADAKNAKAKELPDFPDAAKAEEPKTTSRRGASKDKEEAKPKELKVGVVAKITNKRGKDFTGTVVELDGEVVVLKFGNGDEEEINRDRIASFEIAGDGEGSEDHAEDDGSPKVGQTVTVVTKRGKEVTGKIVELDAEVIVLDVDGKDQEFDIDRVETIKQAGVKAEEPKSSRRGAAKDDAADAPKDEKTKRASNEGVSIGTRIKELIADNLDVDEAGIAKILKKEGLEFKENTLKLNFVDCHKFLAILKAKKLLK